MKSVLLCLVLMGTAAWGGDAGFPGQWSGEQALPLDRTRDAYTPDVAWGNDVFLVAWKSGHLGPGDLRKGFTYVGDIVACLVEKTGKVRSAEPFLVSNAPDLQERPRIAFGSSVFLVVWQDFRNGHDWDIYAARVSTEGKVLDPNGIAISAVPHSQALPEVTWDGSVFQVVWQDYRSDTQYEMYGARIDESGKVLEPQGNLLVGTKTSKQATSRYGAVLASMSAQGQSFLFWRGNSNNQKLPIAGCNFVKGGAVTGNATYEATDDKTTPGGNSLSNFPMCLAAGPETFLAGWTTRTPKGRGEAANDAHGAIFSKEGTMVKKFYLEQKTENEPPRIRNPRAAWNGGHFLATWDSYMAKAPKDVLWPVEVVSAGLVSSAGEVSSTFLVSGTPTEPAVRPGVASDGAGTSIVVFEKHPAKGEIPIHIGYRVLAAK